MLDTAVAPIGLEDFAAEFLRYSRPRFASATLRKRRDALAVLRRLLPGVETTADLTPATMKAFAAAMAAAGLAPVTIGSHLNHFRAVCQFGLEHGYLDSNPIPKRPRGPRRGTDAAGGSAGIDSPPAHDVARLLAHLVDHSASWEGHRLFVLVAAVVYAGLKPGEALRLQWAQYDRDSRRLDLPLRSPPVRQALPPFLADALDQWRPRCGSPWIFPGVRLTGHWNGGPPGQKPIHRLKEAARAAGVGGVTFKQLWAFSEAHPGGISLPGVEARTPPADRSGGPVVPRPGPPRLALDLSRGPRRVRVRGVPLDEPLTPREFAILKALADAARRGVRLSRAELERASEQPDPVRTLRALRERPQLDGVILFPGVKAAGGYGLAVR